VGQLLVVSLSAFTFKLHQNWSLIQVVGAKINRYLGSGIRGVEYPSCK